MKKEIFIKKKVVVDVDIENKPTCLMTREELAIIFNAVKSELETGNTEGDNKLTVADLYVIR